MLDTSGDTQEHMVRPKREALSPWTLSLGLLSFLIVLTIAAFHVDVWRTVQIWYEYPAYSHCFLILPISAWLVWDKRAEIAAETPVAEPLALLLAIFPVLIWLAGYLSTTTELRQVAIVGFFEITLLAILGRRIFRLILFPALFLIFLIPTGEYLIPPLQRLTADFADWGLTQFGVVHYREGTLFELVSGRYSVAEACAGLRFLTATFTLGTLFCYLTFRRWWKIVVFLAACIVFPIAANGVRVLATIMVANYTSNRVAAGMDHIVYGWGFAVVIMLALLYGGSLFRDEPSAPKPTSMTKKESRPGIFAPAAVTAALVAAIAVGPVFAARASQPTTPPDLRVLVRPLKAKGWAIVPVRGAWRPTFSSASAA